MKVKLWKKPNGEAPIEEFMSSLSEKIRNKLLNRFVQLAQYELKNIYQSGIIKKLKDYDLYQLSLRYQGVFVRILLTINNSTCYLLHAFKKKNNETPKKEIKLAVNRKKLLHRSKK